MTKQKGIRAVPNRHRTNSFLMQANGGWLRKESRDFLRRLMAATPFVRRLERALELEAALDSHDSLPPSEVRSAKVTELFGLFDEDHIPKILEECRDAL